MKWKPAFFPDILRLLTHLLERRHGQGPVKTRACQEGVVGRCPEADARELQPLNHRTPGHGPWTMDPFGTCGSILNLTCASIFEPLSVSFRLKPRLPKHAPASCPGRPSRALFHPRNENPHTQINEQVRGDNARPAFFPAFVSPETCSFTYSLLVPKL